MAKLQDVTTLHVLWREDCARYKGRFTPVHINMNQRIRRRFAEIYRNLSKGVKDPSRMKNGKKLDARSEVLFNRIEEEWNSVQPRT